MLPPGQQRSPLTALETAELACFAALLHLQND